MTWTWLAELPTTNARIGVTLLLYVWTGARVNVTAWTPPDNWLLLLTVMAGIDAVQFAAKRFSTHKPEPTAATEV
jgi:hypothetical protein